MAKAPVTKSKPKAARQFAPGALPSREAILEAMAANPQLDGKRDLYKYFGITGDTKTPFKLLLKEMEGEGFLARRGPARVRRDGLSSQSTALRWGFRGPCDKHTMLSSPSAELP